MNLRSAAKGSRKKEQALDERDRDRLSPLAAQNTGRRSARESHQLHLPFALLMESPGHREEHKTLDLTQLSQRQREGE